MQDARGRSLPAGATANGSRGVSESASAIPGRQGTPDPLLAVPETLTAVIAARLDALDRADRSLILGAAVLGQRFTVDALAAAVSGLDPETLEPRLRGLVRRERLALQADPRSPERGRYGFLQALIREVAYNTLAKRDRKDRHLAAARHFEVIGSDELSGALARHYPRGPRERSGGVGGGRARRAGADRAPRRRGAVVRARRERPGDRLVRGCRRSWPRRGCRSAGCAAGSATATASSRS